MYIRVAGKVLLNPIPKRSITGGLKIAYVKRLPQLDIRRAQIDTVTTLNNEITTLVLDITQEIQKDELLEENYFCIVNADGDQTMKSIPYTNIDETTGIVTIAAGFTFEDGETITADDYLVRGTDSTNRSELADTCERYLNGYCNWKVLRRDSSGDSVEQTTELVALQTEIVEIYKETDDDIKYPAIDDVQFLDDEDLWAYY
jgi:hypothetical protein